MKLCKVDNGHAKYDLLTHLAAKLAIAISITQNYCYIYELSAAEPDVTVLTGSCSLVLVYMQNLFLAIHVFARQSVLCT